VGTALVWLCFGVWLVGQVFRDRTFWTALCFYLPSPVAAGFLGGAALLAWWWPWRRLARLAGLLMLGPVAFILLIENQWTRPSTKTADPALRLVHWNVYYGQWGWPDVCAQLQTAQPDICVLSEVPRDAQLQVLADKLGADTTFIRLDDLAVLAKGTLKVEARPLEPGQARAFLVHWQHPQALLKVLVVDLPSSPKIPRDPLLRQVRTLISADQPDLIVGDFNAPRRSLVLSDLPAGYAHAYDLAGAGWSYTWPMPMPAWAIDQCIVGPRLRAGRYDLHANLDSDHRMQQLDFSVPAPGTSPR